MMNAVGTNYASKFMNAFAAGKVPAKNSDEKFSDATNVEISDAGLNALTDAQNSDVNQISDVDKLSDKAKNFLEKLREKYGDYDFMVSSNPNAAQTVGSSKEYSVIFTPEELERMADDDDYAQKVMGQVDDAVGTLKNISEQDLGEGVQFSQLSISFDDDGNMKLFAQLEKLSAEQQERLEAARERRAEEKSEAEAESEDDEPVEIFFKAADIEADSADELLAKIFGIDWNNIAEESAKI